MKEIMIVTVKELKLRPATNSNKALTTSALVDANVVSVGETSD